MSAPDTTFSPFDAALKDGRAVTVRAAVPDDAQALYDYMAAAIPECESTIMTTAPEFRRDYNVEREREILTKQDAVQGDLWLIGETDGEFVASLSCSTRRRKRVAHIGLVGMTMRTTYRGAGLGTAMLRGLIDWAERHPVLERLELEVYADNDRALRLYRGLGFARSAFIPGRIKFGPGEYKDDVIMHRDVRGPQATEAAT